MRTDIGSAPCIGSEHRSGLPDKSRGACRRAPSERNGHHRQHRRSPSRRGQRRGARQVCHPSMAASCTFCAFPPLGARRVPTSTSWVTGKTSAPLPTI